MAGTVHLTIDGPIATITNDHPEKHHVGKQQHKRPPHPQVHQELAL